jgi:mono/diheme cytochrome c family protein
MADQEEAMTSAPKASNPKTPERTIFRRVVNGIEVLAVIAALVWVFMLFANDAGTGDIADAGSPGAAIFASNCATCHGADGEGSIGPRLAGKVAQKYPDIADQIAVVTNGRSGMPSFQGDLSDAQIQQVVEYTRTDLGG